MIDMNWNALRRGLVSRTQVTVTRQLLRRLVVVEEDFVQIFADICGDNRNA